MTGDASSKKLRLGVMCQGAILERWQAEAIERMLDGGHVELVLLIVDSPQNYAKRGIWEKLRAAGGSKFLFNLYLRTLCRPKSRRPKDLSQLFADVPSITCRVETRGGWSQYFTQDDVESILAHDLDLIMRFGFNIIRGSILSAARHGVWSFHHDDELRYRGGPPCFWEIYEGNPETGSVLQRLTDRLDGGVILKKGIFRTKSYSYSANVDQAYFETAKWPAWVCREICDGVADYLEAEPSSTLAPIYRAPTNLQFLRACLLMLSQAIGRVAFRFLRVQRWNVALVELPIHEVIDCAPEKLKDVPIRFLNHSGPGLHNADPFGVSEADGETVFFEQIDMAADGRGRILGARFVDGVQGKPFAPSGLPDCHLSYPLLIQEDGARYLIPESSALREVGLYRAVDYPFDWERVAVLLRDQAFVDATMLQHEGLYWLFYTVNGDGFDADVHLHLAFADRLEGPYREHPANPVKISARSSRPAGTPFFTADGRLVRPAQNFCRSYGGSTIFNEVTRLDPTGFSEREIKELLPFHPDYPDGLHTVAKCGDQTLVDMKRHEFRF